MRSRETKDWYPSRSVDSGCRKSKVRKRVKSTLWSTFERIVGPVAQPASASRPSSGIASQVVRRLAGEFMVSP